MKKLSYIMCALLLFTSVGIFSSCGDNTDFWGIHQLTDEEIAEMERQQRIADSLKSVINADLILTYVVEDYPLTGWNNNELFIETDKIAELFGLTEEQVIAGINQEAGAPDITGFAIQGSTHADVASASNTNGTWGHWWDKNGDVCTSYNQEEPSPSAFYCEWDGEKFGVGQFPGHLEAGDEITVLEGLKYQDKRVVCAVTFRCVERGEVKAGIVGTQELTLETAPNDAYESVPVPEFDPAKVLSDLGVSSWDGVEWICKNAEGGYEQEYNADPHPGFWYDKLGFKGAWGDDASVFVLFNAEDQVITVGQMPGQMIAGSTVDLEFNAVAGEKIEQIIIHVIITAYEDPETAPEGEPASIEKDITVTQAWNDTYAAVEYDVREELRQAFKMTTYQIYSAIKSGDLRMWIDEVGSPANEDGTPGYTGGAPGYWLDANGKAVGYGDGLVYGELHNSEESLVLAFGNHPENFSPNGGQVKTKYVIELNGVMATYNITYDITASE